MKTKLLLVICGLSIWGVAVHAQNITNNIKGVGPKEALINPYFCIQDSNGVVTYALAPGATVDVNKYSGNPYYAGGAIRFGGCDVNKNSYLGYAGISGTKVQYTAPEGIHVVYANPAMDGSGRLTGDIHYTQINPNFNFPAARDHSLVKCLIR
jgi:endoglucanase